MEPTEVLPIVSLVSLVAVEYGGWALLTFLTGRGGLSGPQLQFFRAGHAHAGVLLVLSLLVLRYVDEADLPPRLRAATRAHAMHGQLVQRGRRRGMPRVDSEEGGAT